MKLYLTWCKDNKWEAFSHKPALGYYYDHAYWRNKHECGHDVNRPKCIRGRVTKPTCWVGEVKEWKVTK